MIPEPLILSSCSRWSLRVSESTSFAYGKLYKTHVKTNVLWIPFQNSMDSQWFRNAKVHGFPWLLNGFQKVHGFKNKRFLDSVQKHHGFPMVPGRKSAWIPTAFVRLSKSAWIQKQTFSGFRSKTSRISNGSGTQKCMNSHGFWTVFRKCMNWKANVFWIPFKKHHGFPMVPERKSTWIPMAFEWFSKNILFGKVHFFPFLANWYRWRVPYVIK